MRKIIRTYTHASPKLKKLGEKNPEALLDVANHSSERLAVQHTAFIATCAYVLVIVFGTTDLDLLIGKGIRLPFVGVEMPIVGFFAFAPFILVLVHFNLLLQLQLLSRKLFAFDAAVQQDDAIGGLRDRLHIFPFTYYLVGQPSPLVKPFLAVMVSITLVQLPLFVLFSMQFQFLAYQDETVTWLQRMAIWLDVALITIFWPTILHPKDEWKSYWRTLIAAHVPRRWVWVSFLLLIAGFIISLFAVAAKIAIAGAFVLLLSALSFPFCDNKWQRSSRSYKVVFGLVVAVILALAVWVLVGSNLRVIVSLSETTVIILFFISLLVPIVVLWHNQAPRGSFTLLLTLFVGLQLPLAFMVDGEHFEQLVWSVQSFRAPETFFSGLLEAKRRLDLDEQLLFVKPLKPETLALIRSGRWDEVRTQVEPINLKNRNLRHAALNKAMLIGADLRKANLQGADLGEAELQCAKLGFANLQSADLTSADLQGTDLGWSRLQGADLSGAKLQGANLSAANLQGANLSRANLQGAKLGFANLQRADLTSADLQGTDLGWSRLQGADLSGAKLQGAYLRNADLQGADLRKANFQGADLKDAKLLGADLTSADLQGADLTRANLKGANLSEANLQGADLSSADLQSANLKAANLQGTDLRFARLYAADVTDAVTTLVDATGVIWKPLDKNDVDQLLTSLQTDIGGTDRYQEVTNRLKRASIPDAPQPYMESILAEAHTPVSSAKWYDSQKPKEAADFTRQLYAFLVALAGESPEIARGIIHQISFSFDGFSSRKGLEAELSKHLDDKKSKGMQGLTSEEKELLRGFK